MTFTRNHITRAGLSALALSALALAGCAQHSEDAQRGPIGPARETVAPEVTPEALSTERALCEAVTIPDGSDFVRSTPDSYPGAWLSPAGDVIGYSEYEDEPVYADPACAVTAGRAALDSLAEVCSQGPFEGMSADLPELCGWNR